MYNRLLENVVTVINSTTNLMDSKEDNYSDFYNAFFSPEIHQERMTRKMRREKIRNGLIAGATSLAVVGELYHVAKRTDILKKITRR